MKSKFNIIGERKHNEFDKGMSYADWLKNYENNIMINMQRSELEELKYKIAKEKENSFEQRISRLEEAVFGEYDDGK